MKKLLRSSMQSPGCAPRSGFFLSLGLTAALYGCVTTPEEGDAGMVTTAHGLCHNLAPETTLHPLLVCGEGDQRQIISPAGQQTLSVRAVQRETRSRLLGFLATTDYPAQALQGAEVEVWLEAPLFGSREPWLRYFVRAPGGNFSLTAPVRNNGPAPDLGSLRIFGRELYPQSEGFLGGEVMVYPTSGALPADVAAAIAGLPMTTQKTRGGRARLNRIEHAGGAFVVRTAGFSEGLVRREILNALRPQGLVADAAQPRAYGHAGYRLRLMSFPLQVETTIPRK